MKSDAFTRMFVGIFLFGFIASHADAQEKTYVPCEGPQLLRQIDTWEQQGIVADLREWGNQISPERLAEKLIADCSEKLALLSAAAEIDKNSALRAVLNLWQTNLDFMKWWLQNRRSKIQKP